MNSFIAVSVGSFAAAALVTPAAIRFARRVGLVDRPGPLKPQSRSVPYLGGIGVFAACVVGTATGRPLLIVPLLLAVALGTLDDWRGLSPWLRLLGEVIVGAVAATVVPTRLGFPIGPIAVAVVTILLVNAVNLLDGLDALAGAVVAVAGAAFAALLVDDGRDLALSLACGLAGFLIYNRPPARIYLGDGGSYLLGATLALLLAQAWAPGVHHSAGIAALSFVAVPVAEVVFAIVRRVRAHTSILEGDRGHLYDRLRARGWAPVSVTLFYVAVEDLLAGAALAASAARSVVPALGVACAAAIGLTILSAAGGALVPDTGPRT